MPYTPEQDVIIAIIATIIAICTAAFVVLQAYETRRATKASGKALIAAQAVAFCAWTGKRANVYAAALRRS